MIKYIVFIVILLLPLIIFIPSTESQSSNKLIYPIVSDIVSGGWRVVWVEKINDIDRKVFQINVSNLELSNRNFNLTLLINNATFSLQQTAGVEAELFLLENRTGWELQPMIQQISLPCLHNLTLTCTSATITSYNNITSNKIEWVPSKSQLVQRNAARFKRNMGIINIPRKTAEFENDGVVNATKQFMLEVRNIPISRTKDGWGSKVRLSFINELTGNEYHPWANTSFNKVRNITIRNRSPHNVTNYSILLKVTFDSDMNKDFKDLRFYFYNGTTDIETKLVYWVQNYTASSQADVWVGRIPRISNVTDLSSNNITIRMYYANLSVVYNESNGNKTFLDFGEIPNAFDDATRWENETECTTGFVEYGKNLGGAFTGMLRLGTDGEACSIKKRSEFYFDSTKMAGIAVKAKMALNESECTIASTASANAAICIQNLTGSSENTDGSAGARTVCGLFRRSCDISKVTSFRLNCQDASGNDCFAPVTEDITSQTNAINKFRQLELLYSNRTNNITIRLGETSGVYTMASSTLMPDFVGARLRFAHGVLSDAGNLADGNSTWDWILIRQHTQPEPQYSILAEQTLSNSAIRFYNNRSNATLIRNGSRVIYNINWTINNTGTQIFQVILETNITATIRNFTNATQFHSAKYNITNTSVRKGRFYWKSYAKTSGTTFNSTNRMFVLVDNVRPIMRVVNIPTNTLNPVADLTITDNLALNRCWYNITEQATPNVCVGVCPTYFTCSTDPTLSGLTNSASYRFWLTANDTSGNLNITRGDSINIFNWTVSSGDGGGGGGGGGGGSAVPTLFAINVACTTDSQCASGICDPNTKVCTTNLCGNTFCDRDRGETIASCSQDCATLQEVASGKIFQEKSVAGFVAFALIAGTLSLTFLRRKKKRKKEARK